MDTQIGRVTHYFDKLGVAIVQIINHPLNVGDTVRFSGHDKEFTQAILSVQIEGKNVQKVDVGQTVGIKVDSAVKPGDLMFLANG